VAWARRKVPAYTQQHDVKPGGAPSLLAQLSHIVRQLPARKQTNTAPRHALLPAPGQTGLSRRAGMASTSANPTPIPNLPGNQAPLGLPPLLHQDQLRQVDHI